MKILDTLMILKHDICIKMLTRTHRLRDSVYALCFLQFLSLYVCLFVYKVVATSDCNMQGTLHTGC